MIRLLAGGTAAVGFATGITAAAHADAPELTFGIGWGTGGFAHYTMAGPDGTLIDGGVLYLAPELNPLVVTVVLNTNPLNGHCSTAQVRLRAADGAEESHDVTACSVANAEVVVAEAPSSTYRGVCVAAGPQWRCLGKPPA